MKINKNMKAKHQSIWVTVWAAIPLLLLAAGCNQKTESSTDASSASGDTNVVVAAPDNTAKNARGPKQRHTDSW